MTKTVLYVAIISISIYELSLKATNKTVARLLCSIFLIKLEYADCFLSDLVVGTWRISLCELVFWLNI